MDSSNVVPFDQLTVVSAEAAPLSIPSTPKREAWTEDELKGLRRVAKRAEDNKRELNFMLQCRKCEQMVHFEESHGGVVLVCACTVREMV